MTPLRYVVTCAPPNPNGDLHVGHLSGPFLGGDVAARYLRSRGHHVAYVGYADEFSCYISRKASELGTTPERTAYVYGHRIGETLSLAAMGHDYFTHPLREPLHSRVIQEAFTVLWNNGALRVRVLPVFWCESCNRYLYEAEVRGICQYCAAPADGFYCEECGRPQDTTGLGKARCTACGATATTRQLPRIVLPLDEYRVRLREYYESRPLRPRLREFISSMLSHALPEATISRAASYGVPVPLGGEWHGHVLDTWFSGIWGYIAATKALGAALADEALAEAWSSRDTRVVEFLGFDCSFSHALLWPALAMAHGNLVLPEAIVTNEFYQLEGQKFSTSRGHAVWGSDILRIVPADVLRFYLCLTGPETEQTSFAMSDFRRFADTFFGKLDSWCNSVFAATRRAPEAAMSNGAVGPGRTRVDALARAVADALEPAGFSLRAAAAAIETAVDDLGRRAGDEDSALDQAEALARFGVVVAPLMPAWSTQVLTALGVPAADPLERVWRWPDTEALVQTLEPARNQRVFLGAVQP